MNNTPRTPDRSADNALPPVENTQSADLSGVGLSRLIDLGLLSLLGYGWLAWRYPLAVSLEWPRGGWYPPQQAVLSNLWVHLAVYGLLFGAYWLALKSLPQRRRGGEERQKGKGKGKSGPTLWLFIVIAVWLAASTVLLWATPGGDSHDIYDYIYRGRLQVEKDVSPLAVTPKAAPRMAFYAYTAWKENVDTYGPLWEYASGGVSWTVNRWLRATGGFPPERAECPNSPMACDALMAWVTGYRLLAILLTGLAGWLIYGLLAREHPHWALPALLVWLWNPAVILSSALGAHNDGLMLLLLLFSFWAAQGKRWLLAFLFVGLSAHVKLTALIWLPILSLWLWRQIGFRRALLAGLGAAALLLPLSWLLYQPMGGWETLPRMLSERLLYVANSPSQFVDRLLPELGYRLNKEFVRFWIIRVPSYAFAVLGIALPAWLLWRRRLTGWGSQAQLWALALAAALLYLTVGSFWFQHWYVLWATLPAALLPWSRFTRSVLPAVCLGPLAANIIAETLSQLPVMIISVIGLTGVIVVVIWLPGLMAGIIAVRR